MSRAWQWIKDRYHFLLAFVWVALAAPSMIWWASSVAFVILISLYANYEASMAADEGKRDRKLIAEIRSDVADIKDFLGVDRVVRRDK